jgi:hypothetical protein
VIAGTEVTGCAGFSYPIHDMNDAFFAMLMQAVYTSSTAAGTVTASTAFIVSRDLYYGTPGNSGLVPGDALVAAAHPPPRFSEDELNAFKNKATIRGRTDVATIFSQPAMPATGIPILSAIVGGGGGDLDNLNGHIENMYLGEIAALDPATLPILKSPITEVVREIKAGKFRIIGDRNWLIDGEPVYLAVVRVEADKFQMVNLIKNTATGTLTAYSDADGVGWIAVYDK